MEFIRRNLRAYAALNVLVRLRQSEDCNSFDQYKGRRPGYVTGTLKIPDPSSLDGEAKQKTPLSPFNDT